MKSQDEIHNFFDSNSGKEFVRFYDEGFHEGSRVQYHWFAQDAIGRGNKPYTYPVKIIMKAFISVEKVLKVKRHSDVEFQKGSNWFSITDDLANYVLSKEEWVDSIFRNTYCCDEVFIQTIIYNSQYKDKLYWTNFDNDMHAIMRLIVWEGTGPKVFTMGDKELIEKCDYLFGRKFDWNVDSEIVQFVYQKSALK